MQHWRPTHSLTRQRFLWSAYTPDLAKERTSYLGVENGDQTMPRLESAKATARKARRVQSLLVSADDWEGGRLIDGSLAAGMTERRA